MEMGVPLLGVPTIVLLMTSVWGNWAQLDLLTEVFCVNHKNKSRVEPQKGGHEG